MLDEADEVAIYWPETRPPSEKAYVNCMPLGECAGTDDPAESTAQQRLNDDIDRSHGCAGLPGRR